MKLIKPSFEILDQQPGLEGIYKQIELAGRTCYKSEDKITEATNDILILGKTKVGYISISIVISFGVFIVSGYIQNKLNKSKEI